MERWPMKRKKLFTVLVYIPDVLYRPACFVRCIREAAKIMYSIHNLNFNILNTYKTTLSMK